jgi:hypothetical protein
LFLGSFSVFYFRWNNGLRRIGHILSRDGKIELCDRNLISVTLKWSTQSNMLFYVCIDWTSSVIFRIFCAFCSTVYVEVVLQELQGVRSVVNYCNVDSQNVAKQRLVNKPQQ